MNIVIKYSESTPTERRKRRVQYVEEQQGKCYHCQGLLKCGPPEHITDLKIDWSLFPPFFLKHPVHLHHDHDTDLTIGAVHAYCNAVLWQYHGE